MYKETMTRAEESIKCQNWNDIYDEANRNLNVNIDEPPVMEVREMPSAINVKIKDSALDVQVGGNHYSSMKIQPIEFINQNEIPYMEANVIKYVTRHKSKNGKQDIDKAIHYLEMIKETHYKG